MDYFQKYLKYKNKYLEYKNQVAGTTSSIGINTGKRIKFIERMKKSWRVEPIDEIDINNQGRGLHVETDMNGLENKEFTLGNC